MNSVSFHLLDTQFFRQKDVNPREKKKLFPTGNVNHESLNLFPSLAFIDGDGVR